MRLTNHLEITIMGLPQLKASNHLNIYNPIHVLTNTKKSLREAKNVIKRRKKSKKELDNPSITSIDTKIYLDLMSKLMVFRRKNGLTVVGLELLIYCYNEFLQSNDGVTARVLCKAYGMLLPSEIQNTRNKLDTLCKRGYLLKIGSTCNGASLYIPTVKAITDLSAIFK